MKHLQEIYSDFSLISFEKIEMTKLSKILPKKFTHDVFTKMLLTKRENFQQDLWKETKSLLRNYENEEDGCILIDDTLLKKPYSKINSIITKNFDHSTGKYIKSICMLNFHYTDKSGISIPLSYEIIKKTEAYMDKKSGKNKLRSPITKNQLLRDNLDILTFKNSVKFKYILADKWFGSNENMDFIDNNLNKKFIFPVKKNRLVALSKDDKINGKYVNISSINMSSCDSRLVYFKDCETLIKLTKQVSKNGNDGETTNLYFSTNDITLSPESILEIYKRRWKIEEYHKSLKQNVKIEHSPTKVETSQLNHIFLSICSFLKLEKLRLNFNINHFSLKSKLYIEAIKLAYQKLQTIKNNNNLIFSLN
jgi:hypothetical protein